MITVQMTEPARVNIQVTEAVRAYLVGAKVALRGIEVSGPRPIRAGSY